MVKVVSLAGLRLEGLDEEGHSVIMDAPKASGGEGSGFTPMNLLLIALGGCTTIDVISIMKKQRQDLAKVEVHVDGVRADEHPRYYKEIRLRYVLKGKAISEEASKKAISLSLERYCSAVANLRGVSKITSSYEIQED